MNTPPDQKEYQKTVTYKRSKSAREKINKYSASVEISAMYKDVTQEETSGAVKTNWNNTHSFSTSTNDVEKTSYES